MTIIRDEILSRQANLDKIAGQYLSLKTFHGVLAKIIAIINNPASSAKHLAEVIQSDPALASRVLTIVNSPLYALSQQVTNLSHAIALLGFNEMRHIAMGVSFFDAFSIGERIHLVRLWKHSIYCAKLAELLATQSRYLVDEAFTVGLLHDIGMILLLSYSNRVFVTTLYNYKFQKGQVTFPESEEKMLGLNHTHIGAYASMKWNFPGIITETILCHHNLRLSDKFAQPTQYLTRVLFLADQLCKIMGVASVEHVERHTVEDLLAAEEIYSQAGLDREKLELALARIDPVMQEAEKFFSLLGR
ncbi:MAG: HDOD domain-containing protein [Armatimonadetes bacterium]|nr:HDOD domain-containing protein [Armatimonadota bacterium]